MRKTFFLISLVVLNLFALIHLIIAQEAIPSPTPTDEQRRLKEEIETLKLRVSKATEETNLIKAAPSPSTSPLTGTATFTKTDTLDMEVQIQAYKALRGVTNNIACEIRSIDGVNPVQDNENKIVLFQKSDYEAWRNFNLIAPTLEKQLENMTKEYEVWLTSDGLLNLNGKDVVVEGQTRISRSLQLVERSIKATEKALETIQRVIGKFNAVSANISSLQVAGNDLQTALGLLTKAESELKTARDNKLSGAKLIEVARPAENKINQALAKLETAQSILPKSPNANLSEAAEEVMKSVESARSLIDEASILTEELTKNGAGSPALGTALTAASTGLAGITNTIKAVADVLALFRSEVSFSQSEITLNEDSVRSSMAQSLNTNWNGAKCRYDKKFIIYDPKTFFAAKSGGAFNSRLLPLLKELTELRSAAQARIALYTIVDEELKKMPALEKAVFDAQAALDVKNSEVVTLETQFNAVKKPSDAKNELEVKKNRAIAEQRNMQKSLDYAVDARDKQKNRLSSYSDESSVINRVRITRLTALNNDVTSLLTTLNTATGGSTLLSQYVKAENLVDELSAGKVYWLQINAVKGGGNTRVIKNLFRYFYYPDIKHSGGSILQYSLSDSEGKVIGSNTSYFYQKYEPAKKITN